MCVCVHACHMCMNGLTCRCFDLWASDSRHIWFNYLHPPVDLEAQVCKAWPLHPSFMAASECVCVCVCVFAGVRMCVHTYKVRDRMRTFNWNLFYVWSRFIVVRKYSVSNFVGYFHPKMCRILRLLPDTTVFLLYLAVLCTKKNITFQHQFGFPWITHHQSLRMRVFFFFLATFHDTCVPLFILNDNIANYRILNLLVREHNSALWDAVWDLFEL